MAMPVTCGLFLSHQKPPQEDPIVALRQQLEMVRVTRDAGWDMIMTGQHYLLEEVRKLQPLPFLARIAAESGDMRLSAGILLLALQNPAQAAEEVGTLDVITGGRFVLGTGLGYREAEFNALGVSKKEGVHRFETNLRIVTELLEGKRVTVDEPWCRMDDAVLQNRPVQRPRPPIWIGANADPAVERAAKMADTWIVNPHAKKETVVRQLELFRATRIEAGLSPDPDTLPVIKEIFCAETREEAFRNCLPYLGEKYRHYVAWGQDGATPSDDSIDLPIEELVDERFVIGTPDDCMKVLSAWRDELNVDHFIFRTEWVGMPNDVAMSSLRLLSETVVPALAAGRTTL